MIIPLLCISSLVTIYFSRLLIRKSLKVGALAIAFLYIVLVIWTYLIFIIDVARLGFNDTETGLSILIGSDIYHSFVDINSKMSFIPTGILHSIVYFALIILISGFLVVFHGIVEITRAFISTMREKNNAFPYSKSSDLKKFDALTHSRTSIIRLYCRMNC